MLGGTLHSRATELVHEMAAAIEDPSSDKQINRVFEVLAALVLELCGVIGDKPRAS